MRADWDVIVIGAGLVGLAAGATATRAGSTTLVLDAHEPGGRARVTSIDGFVFNRGLHALYKGGAGWEVLRSLGIEPQGSSPPLGRCQVLAGGELHLLPTSADSLRRTTLLGHKDKVVCITDGGPNRRAARRPVAGSGRVARLLISLARRYRHLAARPAVVGGSAGAVLWAGGTVEQVMAVTSKDRLAASVYFVGNPDKLTSVGHPPLLE